MAFMNWNDKDFSVGISEIDEQHKKLVDMINSYHAAIRDDKDKSQMKKLLDNLATYTVTHFKNEEQYFKKFAYVGLESHINEHKKLLDDVTKYINDMTNGKMILSITICKFLRDWLVNHIQGTDRKYVQCFKENGLS